MSLPSVTVIGTLTADPELRFIPSGKAVINFTVAANERKFNKDTQKYEDGEAAFLRCNLWGDAAENAAESLARGNRVIVTGRLKQRSWETKEGEKRTVMELEVDEVGPSLKWNAVKIAAKGEKASAGASFGSSDSGPDW